MTLGPTSELMRDAFAAETGLGAFNVVHLETAEALIAAAETAGLPVTLQISQNCARYHGALEPIALATLSAARASNAHVAVHLDHAEDEALTGLRPSPTSRAVVTSGVGAPVGQDDP